MNELVIVPANPLVDAPITILLKGMHDDRTVYAQIQSSETETFTVPIEPAGSADSMGQFSVSSPGHYRATVGALKAEFTVQPRQDLSFSKEFGFFSLVVFIAVGGMLIWLRKKRRT